MRFSKLFAAALCGLTLSISGVASADTGQLAGLEDEVHGLAERATALRERAARSHSTLLMHECDRIVKVVDSERLFLATRLDIFHITGSPPAELVAQTADRADRANKLLALVERWFGPR